MKEKEIISEEETWREKEKDDEREEKEMIVKESERGDEKRDIEKETEIDS